MTACVVTADPSRELTVGYSPQRRFVYPRSDCGSGLICVLFSSGGVTRQRYLRRREKEVSICMKKPGRGRAGKCEGDTADEAHAETAEELRDDGSLDDEYGILVMVRGKATYGLREAPIA